LDQANSGENQAEVPTSEPKKSNRIWYIIGVVVILAAGVASTYMLINKSNPTGNTWSPKVGDFVMYNASGGGFQMTMRMEVKAVTASSMSINTTIKSNMGGGSVVKDVPLNNTMGSSYNLKNPPSGVTTTLIGTESVSTKWGSASATRYTVVDQTTPGLTITTDVWVKDKVLIKLVQVATGVTTTMTLTDTNIKMITG
jgi:hypothetical protein